MKHKTVPLVLTLLVAAALFLWAGAAYAQGAGFDLSWWTVDGGGGSLAGGGYSLSGTLGQPDAGTLSGGGYTLSGGFWSASPSAPQPGNWKLMLPIVTK